MLVYCKSTVDTFVTPPFFAAAGMLESPNAMIPRMMELDAFPCFDPIELPDVAIGRDTVHALRVAASSRAERNDMILFSFRYLLSVSVMRDAESIAIFLEKSKIQQKI